jgi:ABC-type molybdenum transport system ATPase subunit/photorepair protein PhrA
METFDIHITPSGSGYKSIKTLDWTNIPPLSIITGKNGSGKTQLLELLAYHFTGTGPPQGLMEVSVNIEGLNLDADEIGFVPSKGHF